MSRSTPRLLGRGLTVRYPTSSPLSSVDLEFSPEDYPVAITGPSGSGKTTLLRVLGGLHAPTEGQVLIDNTPVQSPTWRAAADPRVGFVHQDYRLVPFLTVGENLDLAMELRGEAVWTISGVEEALQSVGLPTKMLDRKPETLSGGEQQRTAIARMLVAGCSVLLADEPTGALDADNTDAIASLLQDVCLSHGVAVVIATHDQHVSARATSRFRLSAGDLCRIA